MLFFPNCKINIGLDVLRRRDDGFHDISTVMMPVPGLCDVLEIAPSGRRRGLGFTVSGIGAGAADDNLCVRAYNLMAERYGLEGAGIHLHKIIPAGAGLGGGSSDAAFTLKGLNKVFSLGLDSDSLESLAAELGSDTAFFIRNETCLASGRGEILEPFALNISGLQIVIVKPAVSISTAAAYAAITPHIPEIPLAQRMRAGIDRWNGTITNAFEPWVFAEYPAVKLIREQMYAAGAQYASMSGSGSAVYGLFASETDAGALRTRMANSPEQPFVYQQCIV